MPVTATVPPSVQLPDQLRLRSVTGATLLARAASTARCCAAAIAAFAAPQICTDSSFDGPLVQAATRNTGTRFTRRIFPIDRRSPMPDVAQQRRCLTWQALAEDDSA